MSSHRYTQPLSKKSSQVLEELSIKNDVRRPKYLKTFVNGTTSEVFEKNDVEIIQYKRNKMFKTFLGNYINDNYTMIEMGFDFSINSKAADIILKVKRNLSKSNTPLLGYIYVIDKCPTSGTMHFHIILAMNRINAKGMRLDKNFKFTFKKKKIHSSFVINKRRTINYLCKKEVYDIGKRKRVHGKSRLFQKTEVCNDKLQNSYQFTALQNNLNKIKNINQFKKNVLKCI